MASSTGCITIIFNREGKILLVKRKDYPVWDLPGGRLEENEKLEVCAIREAEEETGYLISIERKIGEYFQPQYDDMQHLFLAEVEGGKPIENGDETEGVQWFPPRSLPLLMIPNRRRQIQYFLKNKEKLHKESLTVSPLKIYLYKQFLTLLKKIR